MNQLLNGNVIKNNIPSYSKQSTFNVKTLILGLLFLFAFQGLFAMHIKGGWIQYQYLGVGSSSFTTSKYQVTVYLYTSCTTSGPVNQVILGVFDAVTNSNALAPITIATNSNYSITDNPSGCISNATPVCYHIYTYTVGIELPNNANGYNLGIQDAKRVKGMVNISNSGNTGITFTSKIPGIMNGSDYHINNSPVFVFQDTAIVCHNSAFALPFSATDVDGDSLSYSFGDGLDVPNASGSTSSNAPSAPPYTSLTYISGYSGAQPMGSGVTINSVTGLISGIAPATTGEYDIAVYVSEYRNGVLLQSLKKELQITVGNCSLTAAILNPAYINCGNYSFTFANQSTASSITNYYWDFGVKTSATDTSSQPTPTYNYADTGTYTLKLKVTNSTGCSDSTTAPVKVYPGFTPNFTYTGSCYASPFYFKDATFTKFGYVNSWTWNFGDVSTSTDTSTFQNPSYQYSAASNKTVLLTVTSSKGCTDTITKTVVVNDKPIISMPFTDTLICSNDTLPLIANSTGTFSWSPNYKISNTSIYNPKVYPQDTTTYTVTVTDGGCVNTASIKVNVLQFITVDAGNDTTLCTTDSILLRPVSYALSYVWTPTTGLSNNLIKNPLASPAATIKYYVTANLGHCQDHDSLTIHVSPYPKANAGNDTLICYHASAQLNGTITGAYFSWSPLATLTNATTLSPIASPLGSTNYVLTVTDTFYCPKPFTDTILVTVVPKVIANAGNDTSIVFNQPLQLNATGALSYIWTPSTWLNNPYIATPIATISSAFDSIRYYVTAYSTTGCNGTSSVLVKVFTTGPDIFVPSGFTPNGDGKNDILKPILVGISTFNYFKIYNRFGQMVFSTNQIDKGWDGLINNQMQTTGTYIYMAQGIDYLGKTVLRKGTVILIR